MSGYFIDAIPNYLSLAQRVALHSASDTSILIIAAKMVYEISSTAPRSGRAVMGSLQSRPNTIAPFAKSWLGLRFLCHESRQQLRSSAVVGQARLLLDLLGKTEGPYGNVFGHELVVCS